MGWKRACRFVAMRKQEDKPTEGKSRSGQAYRKYTYREFVTNRKEAHKVIDEYDKRADSENLIGRQNGGVGSDISNSLAPTMYFQIVMLSYNI